jgi:salicylate hydroxylase
VAIVGGGIVGVALALGLIERGLRVSVYERASEFPEIGVGFAFTGVARKCMEQLSPAVIEALKKVASENQHSIDNYWDGYNHDDETIESSNTKDDNDSTAPVGKLLFQLPNADMAWWSCLRSQFLNAMAQALPKDVVLFKKELADYEETSEGQGPVKLRFTDGSAATADVLIGCDGLRSAVRQQLFSTSHPEACHPSYTHKTCYRAVIPMAVAEAVLGTSKPHNHCMHTGPRAHILNYPVAQHTLLNVVIFLQNDGPWAEDGGSDKEVGVPRMTRPGRKADIEERLAEWRPEVRALVAALPDTPTTWGIFDTADHPAPFYAQRRVCLVGDAAHASSPHHGAGAGMGVEDALALATSLGIAAKPAATTDKAKAVEAALQAFNDVRYERSQWLVRSSRETGDIYEWMFADSGSDPVKLRSELQARQRKIWDFDVDAMVRDTDARYHAKLEGNTVVV